MKGKTIAKLVDELGRPYHELLGINLRSSKKEEIFKWFVASSLFGARISETIAMKTYKQFEKDGLLSPERIIARGWSRLVESLDRGGYVRYDFSTADDLLALSDLLMRSYGGDLNRLHDQAKYSVDLEACLKEFRGVGDVTANIFLRELREVWKKADPLPGQHVILAARNLGLIKSTQPVEALDELRRVWRANAVPRKTFVNFEVALSRLGRLYCNKSKCEECPVYRGCKRF
jgi:endonuclease III